VNGGTPGPTLEKAVDAMTRQATFRFYEELNDFLPPGRRKTAFPYSFHGSPAVKDAIEALGVPHAEVDLILVDGESVDFSHRLRDGETVSVYPVFESLDIAGVTRLRGRPLRDPRFILDVHLGKLARCLRLLGFDTLYDTAYEDREIIRIAAAGKRTILTRDVQLLKHGGVDHGYWVRSTRPLEQAAEILDRFDLRPLARPFSRCTVCNGLIEPVEKEAVAELLQPKTRAYYDEFFRCASCGRVYWKGSHYERMRGMVEGFLGGGGGTAGGASGG